MEIPNLPDNSRRPRPEKSTTENVPAKTTPKRVDKVVTGKVKVKKNEMRKLTDIFISEDASKVKDYVIFDVIIPAIKKSLYDIVVNSLDMTLFGGRGSRRSSSDSRGGFCDYNGVSTRRRDRDRDYDMARVGRDYGYEELYYERRADAEHVLDCMYDDLRDYGHVSISAMKSYSNVSSNYTDQRFGWTDLRDASIRSTRDGWKIILPEPVDLKRDR